MNCLSLCYKCEDMVKEEIDIIVRHYTNKLLVDVEQVVLAQTSNIVADFAKKIDEAIALQATTSNVLPLGSSVITHSIPSLPSANTSSQ